MLLCNSPLLCALSGVHERPAGFMVASVNLVCSIFVATFFDAFFDAFFGAFFDAFFDAFF